MFSLKDIINEEIMNTVANYPQFGDRLNSISETGEANTPAYPFTFDNTSFNEVNYNFDTEEDQYVVIINNVDVQANVWEMQFGTVDGEPEDVVNKGRMYRVMSTMLEITNDFIDRFKPNILRFKPEKVKKNKRVDVIRTTEPNPLQRLNLYMQYMNKHERSDYKQFRYGDYIVLERKIKIKSNIPKI